MAKFMPTKLVLGLFKRETAAFSIVDGAYNGGKPLLCINHKASGTFQVMSPANWRNYGNAEVLASVDAYEAGAKERAALVECATLVKARMEEGFTGEAIKAVALKRGFSTSVVDRVIQAARTAT